MKRRRQKTNIFKTLCKCFQSQKRQEICKTIKLPRPSYLYAPYQDRPMIIEIQNSTKKLLVLDLDETLVHSSFQKLPTYDFEVNVRFNDLALLQFHILENNFTAYISIRPNASEFIQKLAVHYNIVLFTASVQQYADPVMDRIDPKRICQRRLFRQDCRIVRGGPVKDLSIFNVPQKDIVIVDVNSFITYLIEFAFQLQPDNGFLIKSYYGDQNDTTLKDLAPFFVLLSKMEDVRPVKMLYGQFKKRREKDNETTENRTIGTLIQ